MKTGFAHFDNSRCENFCASVLLLAMDADPAVQSLICDTVRRALEIDDASRVLGFGREARLAATGDSGFARTDLWFLFESATGRFYAFVEIKTHNGWNPADVARQVRDQAHRTRSRAPQQVRGSLLLGPERLCQHVASIDPALRTITWPVLLDKLRSLASRSPLMELAIRHLEENMDRPAGLDRPLTLSQFEQSTTTVACLRQFIIDCIVDIGGRVYGEPAWFTPGDGSPRRGSGWAWHGLSVPFSCDGRKGRVGIFKYAEAPPGEESALATLWLEAYLGDGDAPVAFIEFAPPTLAAAELAAVRMALKEDWDRKVPNREAPPGEGG